MRHYGSVDVFLEAIQASKPGDVLVIDNRGRLDEGCIGDLTTLEAQKAGLSGIVVWGAHRDSAQLAEIGFPAFSYGSCPFGPVRLDRREDDALSSVAVGDCLLSANDIAFADTDGCIFVPANIVGELLRVAQSIFAREREQADLLSRGVALRSQLRFDDYLSRRQQDSSYTFREHLRVSHGAIEE